MYQIGSYRNALVASYTWPKLSNDYYPFGSSLPTRSWSDASRAYRYGFNGKEKDGETANDAYDFGARIYDGRLGRWLSLDPLMKEFSSISPFAVMDNSPITFIDRKGERIIIYYQQQKTDENCNLVFDDKGNPEMETLQFEYSPNVSYPNNAFVKATVESLNYLYNGSKKARKEIKSAMEHDDNLKIFETNGANQFDHEYSKEEIDRDKISWNPNKKLAYLDDNINTSANEPDRYPTGRCQSASMGLMHEVLHFVEEKRNKNKFFSDEVGGGSYYFPAGHKDRKYTRGEEKRAIRVERKICRQLGQPQRFNHKGIPIQASNVNEFEDLKEDEYRLVRNQYLNEKKNKTTSPSN